MGHFQKGLPSRWGVFQGRGIGGGPPPGGWEVRKKVKNEKRKKERKKERKIRTFEDLKKVLHALTRRVGG
jgi:hypothetical protein